MPKVLIIVRGTDETLTGKNRVYVNPKVMKELAEGFDATGAMFPTVELVAQSPELKEKRLLYQMDVSHTCPENGIILNSCQRKLLGAEGAQVLIRRVSVASIPPADSVIFFMQRLGRAIVDTTFNVTEMKKLAHVLYDTQILSEGQIIIFKFNGNSLQLTVKRYEVLPSLVEANEKEALVSQLMPGRNLGPEQVKFVTLDATTSIDFEAPPDPKMKLVGARVGLDIFKKGITPKELGIGGLSKQLGVLFRRAFITRAISAEEAASLDVQHIRGVLLYGPPGTGKTLIARQIGKMLHTREPKIVSGPQILNKFVGQSEENIRELFADAEKDQADNGEASDLHLIIFDELDAICKARGSTSGGTGVGDSVVNQLLAKMDGVNSLNNIIVVGMTNRMDMMDPALLRPGRFELHIEVSLPDEKGRQEILDIHTSVMRKGGHLAPDVDLAHIAAITKNYSGAELAGVVKAALSRAIDRKINIEEKFGLTKSTSSASSSASSATASSSTTPSSASRPGEAGGEKDVPIIVCQEDFIEGVGEVIPQLGAEESSITRFIEGGIVDYGPRWRALYEEVSKLLKVDPTATRNRWTKSLLLAGKYGVGKTALAALVAKESGYPFVRILTPDWLNSKATDTNGIAFALNAVFQDALKSPLSLVVIDKLESFIKFTSHASYNQVIAQLIDDWLGVIPPEGHKLFIIATTSRYDELCGRDGGLRMLQANAAYSRLLREQKERGEEPKERSTPKGSAVLRSDWMSGTILAGYRSVVAVPGLCDEDEVSAVLESLNPSWPEGKAAAIAKQMVDLLSGEIPIKTIINANDDAKADNPDDSSSIFMECFERYLEM
ncbi:N-ethylmaleimide sensitive fusion protein [Monocercomonoides exilis]|uniref:N-ethylmaleimide sensitive fusion protein n=1 Tax=Monocercomonoides exilis TaxID=2049356 RepID=UPI00355A0C62|nr:N-ethylmaleimide sensitive fusion protein [Monocercomonoides exilis]|eukprot:MONOS_6092.1-p1 / transcript=MONOS_6092.1 / gene=MONOS_6092 / organism=Monocercomonoides_exilis_PA203 / gene_product=N-ethylmaleimide sensitive fusion proteins / transcript_product=N-ethylmaleimide sensitive fusion proteins / location=Mono_scaffold00187:77849-80637(-) / protein_length=837 / sequence_SO=supercontig / SO=protein_coding / is_pseudo=false